MSVAQRSGIAAKISEVGTDPPAVRFLFVGATRAAFTPPAKSRQAMRLPYNRIAA